MADIKTEDFEDFDDLNSESSDDHELSDEDFSDLVVAPADWTIGTLINQIGKQIDLDPAFQRRNVWNTAAKSSFIESIFLGIPIPQILLSSQKDKKNEFLVLDGKQRLLTLKEFIDGRFQSNRVFRLKKLRVLKELEGKSWADIEGESIWSDRLLNETQRTAVIRNWSSEEVLYEIFYRLNSGSVKLSPMELRMSLHPGDFLKYIINWTETIGPIHKLLGKSQPDPRMNDVELAVRFLAFDENEITYAGDLKAFLDGICIKLNSDFAANDEAEARITAKLDEFNAAIEAGLSVYNPKRFCRKFIDGAYESRFNRAIFDVQVGALANGALREKALEQPDIFTAAFEAVSTDNEFVRAVETTTKSTSATRTRFTKFYAKLEEEFGVGLVVPRIDDN